MGFSFSNPFGSVKDAFGFGKEGSGGSRDAFGDFQKFRDEFQPLFDREQARLAEGGVNPFTHALGQTSRPLAAAHQRLGGQIRGINRQAGRISGQLLGSSLASTEGAQVNAVNTARIAAGGRGGLAFGGGAGAIAARAGQGAATNRAAGLSQAMLQGNQLQLQTRLQGESLFNQSAQALSAARFRGVEGQAQLMELFRRRQDNLGLTEIGAITGLGQGAMVAGLGGDQATAGRRSDLLTGLLGGAAGGFGAGG